MNGSYVASAVTLVALSALACGRGPETTADGAAVCADTELTLQGETDASRVLKTACTYHLAGNYTVVGATSELAIEPGVTIEADGAYAVRLTDGAKLAARGTTEHPIVLAASEAVRAAGWQGLRLGGAATPVRHELHHVTVRDAGQSDEPTDEHPAVIVAPEGGQAEILFDHLTIEDPKHAGLRLYRDGAAIAAGSTDLVVRGGPGYPVVLDALHLTQLAARQSLESTNPTRARILAYGGNEGVLYGDHVWAPQNVPLELGSSVELGSTDKPASLTIQPPATVLLRTVSLRATWGTYRIQSTPTEAIVFDEAEAGKPWGSIVLVGAPGAPLAHQSVIEGVTFRHGGANEPMVYVVGPGGPGSLEDCTTGPTVTGNSFSQPALGEGSVCLAASDHSSTYETSNTFDGCVTDRKCD